MTEQRSAQLILAGLLLLLALLSYTTWQIAVVGSLIETHHKHIIHEEDDMQSITQTATRIRDGAQAEITTTRRTLEDGTLETLVDWLDRHGDAMEAFENS